MSESYFVVNAVRDVHTRLARAQNPERHRFKQFILGGTVRLVRNRPVKISKAQFKEFYDELKGMVAKGAIIVRRDAADGEIESFKNSRVKEIVEKQAEVAKLVEETPVKDDSESEDGEEDEVEESKDDKSSATATPKRKKRSKKKGS